MLYADLCRQDILSCFYKIGVGYLVQTGISIYLVLDL